MNPRPADALNRDALVEQLSRLDSDNPSDVAIAPPPATVSGLKAELDTLIVQLREPAGPDPFVGETGLRRAHELVLAIGAEPESEARSERSELGRIGPYELLEKLGEGGMGAVYKALHSSLEKIVALKILSKDRLNPQAISRFKREMKAVGKLDHPNIVRATDAGEASGDHFLVMEYVEGIDLAELLRRVGPLAAADACELARQTAVGLQHAHQRGLVHRDIKPSNIMLAWSDEHAPTVKILDMGLALLSEPAAAMSGELTATGQLMGTLEYMSPEQSLDTHQVDIRADIYSLGATLHKLLCGKAPFSGERFNTAGKFLVALATETPPSIRTQRNDLPKDLVAIVDRMLARDPAERPATPAEVVQALAPFASGADLTRLAATARDHDAALEALPVTEVVRPLTSPATASLAATAELPKPHALGERGYTKTIVAAVGLLALLGGVLLFGGQLSRIVTNQGQIVIETDGVGIELLIKDQEGKVLVDGETKREITFKAGEYNIEVTVKDSAGEQRFVTDHFMLTRNDKKIVDARWQVAKAKQKLAPASRATDPAALAISTDPDRCAAEWVLSIGGKITIQENGHERQPKAVEDLPRGAFELTVARLDSNPKVNNASLAHFQGCQNLTTLDLQRNKLSDAGLVHFKDCKKLEVLHLLSNRDVTDEGLAHFGDCENLTSLNLADTRLSDAGLSRFRNLKNLTDLHLGATRVTDAGLSHLKDCKNLMGLNLSQTGISDVGLVHFKDCKNLIHLGLDQTQVTDAGLAQFKDCKKITHLSLEQTQVTDAGLVPFQGSSNLTRVSLDSTQVTDAGLAHLKDCNNLSFLTLRDLRVTDAAVADLANMSRLKIFSLANTRMSPRGHEQLKAALPGLKFDWSEPNRSVAVGVLALGGSVEISQRDEQESHPIKNAADLPRDFFQVRRVSLVGVDQPWGKLLPQFAALRFPEFDRLESLDLSGTTLPRGAQPNLDFLAGIHGLRELNLADAGLNDGWLAKLPNLPTLKRLVLDGNDIRGGKGFSRLSGLTNLESLELRRTKVTTVGTAELKQALPNCKILWDEPEK